MTAGPIGIFAFWGNPIEHMPPERTRALLAEAALQEVDLCFFSPADCETGSGLIRAMRWRRGDWQTAMIELPGLVTVIGIPVLPEHHAAEAWLRGRTQVAGFRHRDKRKADALVARTSWAPHVIPSARLDPDRPEEHLLQWLADGGVVVKPNDGTLARGIQFAVPDDGAWLVVRDDRRWRESTEAAAARLARAVRGRLHYREYMVQRYVDSRDSEGRTIGIRVDVARLPGGGWGLIRMVGHVSLNGRLVSNASRGAAKMPIRRLLAARTRPAETLEAEALALAEGVAEALSPEGNGVSNYEYGVDIAIDPEDRLWFIEANPSPQTIWAEHQRAVLVIAYLKSLVSARAARYGEMAG